jgi:hypothetical protein
VLLLFYDPGNASRATSPRAAEILTKVLLARSRSNAPAKAAPTARNQKKLLAFFVTDVLQLFDFERVVTDQMVPFDRDAHERSGSAPKLASMANQFDWAPQQRIGSKHFHPALPEF